MLLEVTSNSCKSRSSPTENNRGVMSAMTLLSYSVPVATPDDDDDDDGTEDDDDEDASEEEKELDLRTLSMAQLKKMLKKEGLKVSGTRWTLVGRLKKHMGKQKK
mmetsp:Transcript_34327/g.47904  ORF Transcript_34327/g.47904 Transcript_34327/m.47904 type:complete len:105 (+) Transcript_34327:1372-1686(+)